MLSRILDMSRGDVYDIVDLTAEEAKTKNMLVANFVDQEQIDQIAFTKAEYSEQIGTKKNPAPSLYGVYWDPFLIRNYPEAIWPPISSAK